MRALRAAMSARPSDSGGALGASGEGGARLWLYVGFSLVLHAGVAGALIAGSGSGATSVVVGSVEIVTIDGQSIGRPSIYSPAPTRAGVDLARAAGRANGRADEKPLAPSRVESALSARRDAAANAGEVPHVVAAHHAGHAVSTSLAHGGAGETPPASSGAAMQESTLPNSSSGGGAPAGVGATLAPRYRLGAAETPSPAYPQSARRRGVEGRVVVRIEVLPDGRAASAAVVESSGHEALDRAAAQTLQTWRLQPALVNGRPAPAVILVPVRFRLEG
ncbi:MAG: energy transducer TonB [Alphaproteobacteria bacterium]